VYVAFIHVHINRWRKEERKIGREEERNDAAEKSCPIV